MGVLRSLRSRLLFWFFGAIALAFVSSALVVGCSRPEAFTTGTEVMAHTMAARVAARWDDPKAVEAYLAEFRDVTGLDATLVRDPAHVPPPVRRAVRRGAAFSPHGPENIYVPVLRHGKIVGAVQMDRYGGGLRPRPLWPILLGLAAAFAILVLAASYVGSRLARPLERLALTANRLGAGDLAARAAGGAVGRWEPDETKKLAEAFDKMADRVEATVRGQRELLGAISHELRSPLGRARVALEIARDRSGGELKTLDTVDRQLTEIDAIVGDLLAVTRAGLADLRREPVSLDRWLVERAQAEPTPPSVEVDVRAIAGLSLQVDAALLGRAVHNLLANARAHGHPDHAPLQLAAERRGDRVSVVVRDAGPGFPPEFLPRAFEPFERGDRSRSRTAGGGTGLGLALVRRIVEAHGGVAFARNRGDGGGAEVGFDLPA